MDEFNLLHVTCAFGRSTMRWPARSHAGPGRSSHSTSVGLVEWDGGGEGSGVDMSWTAHAERAKCAVDDWT